MPDYELTYRAENFRMSWAIRDPEDELAAVRLIGHGRTVPLSLTAVRDLHVALTELLLGIDHETIATARAIALNPEGA